MRPMRLWILVLLAAMLTELSAGMSETAAAVFYTPDDIAVLLTEPAESSDDDPSESPDDACLYRIPRMLPSAALCPEVRCPPQRSAPQERLRHSVLQTVRTYIRDVPPAAPSASIGSDTPSPAATRRSPTLPGRGGTSLRPTRSIHPKSVCRAHPHGPTTT